jgi:peptidyl-dipeptidase Dcp
VNRRNFIAASAATTALAGAPPAAEAAPSTLPLLAAWTGPHNGAPPFDKIVVSDFKPAILVAMEENRAELAAITANPAPATFANTIAAMEKSGRTLNRVGALFGVWTSTLNDKPMQAVEQEMAPALAAFQDEVVQNAALFARVKAVYDARATSD